LLLQCYGAAHSTTSTDQTTYTVEFDVDYNNCGVDPQTYVGGVDFGSAGDVKAGRVCSKEWI
jgi:hypothetical protein